MGRMKALLGDKPLPYPKAPGFKERGGTSEQVAREICAGQAKALRDVVYEVIKWLPRTSDEVAEALHMSILTIRPRLSELRAEGKIVPTGVRRRNASGKMATVWGTPGW
jgi:hypothetical protein